MSLSKLIAAPFRYRPWRPRHARLIARDLVGGRPQSESDHLDHLRAAIDWLCLAQDVRHDKPDSGGVSAGWSFEDGWLPSYPETSGYIVETFLAAAAVLDRPDLIDRARRIIDWELSIQRPDGAFPGHFGEPGSQPVVFNTGQIMHGMLAGYLQLRRTECLEAAVRAGHWLARVQDADGCWRQFERWGRSLSEPLRRGGQVSTGEVPNHHRRCGGSRLRGRSPVRRSWARNATLCESHSGCAGWSGSSGGHWVPFGVSSEPASVRQVGGGVSCRCETRQGIGGCWYRR